MEVLGIVPARGGSSTIPGKNIKLLGGRPLISYTIEEALASKTLSRIVLSTDSAEISAIAATAGVEVPFLRPPEISRDDSPALAYVEHCLKFLADGERYEPEIVVILQPTTPFRNASDIDTCVGMLAAERSDSVVSVSELPSKYHPEWQCEVGPDNSLRTYTRRPWRQLAIRRQDLPPTYSRNGAVYAFWRDTVLGSGSIYGESVKAYVMPPERSVNIDNQTDWQNAETILANRTKGPSWETA